MVDIIAIGLIVLMAIFIFAPAVWAKIKTGFLAFIPDAVENAVAAKFAELGLTKAAPVASTTAPTEVAAIASPLLTGTEARNKVIHATIEHWLALYDSPQVKADAEAKKALDSLKATLINPELVK